MNMNGGPVSSNMNGGNSFRLEYSEEFQRAPVCDQAQNLMNGSLPNGTPHHHPPGFACQLPIAAENGSDCHNVDSASSVLPNGHNVQKTFETNGVLVPVTVSGNGNYNLTENHNQVRVMTFALQDVQVRDYDSNNNNNYAGKIAPPEKSNLKNSNDNASKENASVPPLAESLSNKIAKVAAALRKTESEKNKSGNTEQNKVDNGEDSAYCEGKHDFERSSLLFGLIDVIVIRLILT